MADAKQIAMLYKGAETWNAWRAENPLEEVDLGGAYIVQADLNGIDFGATNLRKVVFFETSLHRATFHGADLREAKFYDVDLGNADLQHAVLLRASFNKVNLRAANLTATDLQESSLRDVDLRAAILHEADLRAANLHRVALEQADLTRAVIGATNLGDIILKDVLGLSTVRHAGPSSIGAASLYLCGKSIPEAFLRGCGVPSTLIEYIPSLIGALQPIQYYSCFISHSSSDEAFARRLYDRMSGEHIRVWYAPEELKGGKRLFDQIDQAIRIHDKLILALSEASMASSWVQTEIRRARIHERRAGQRKLFPIRVVPMEQLQEWILFDTDTGTDLAAEVRSYYIPDFSNWKDHDAFEEAYARLLRDLKAAV